MAGRAQVNHLRESKYRLLSMRSPTVESVLDIAGFLSDQSIIIFNDRFVVNFHTELLYTIFNYLCINMLK